MELNYYKNGLFVDLILQKTKINLKVKQNKNKNNKNIK